MDTENEKMENRKELVFKMPKSRGLKVPNMITEAIVNLPSYLDDNKTFELFSLTLNNEVEESKEVFERKMKVLEMKRTCSAFPDQYELKLEDGRIIYLRLRNECFTGEISREASDNASDAIWGILLFRKELSQVTVNRTEIKEALKEAGCKVDWKGCEYIDYYRLPSIHNYSLLGKIIQLKEDLMRKIKITMLNFNLERTLNYHRRLARKKEFNYAIIR
jgi:hypothetical protein